MIRPLWHCIKSSAIRDVQGAYNEASGEMDNTGAFSEDTKAVPNYLLKGVENKGPQPFREASSNWPTR